MLDETKPKNMELGSISSSQGRELTPDAMAEIGLQSIVYVQPVQARDISAEIREIAVETKEQLSVAPDTWFYAVHAANGVRLAIVDSRAGALEGARAYGYEPLSVH